MCNACICMTKHMPIHTYVCICARLCKCINFVFFIVVSTAFRFHFLLYSYIFALRRRLAADWRNWKEWAEMHFLCMCVSAVKCEQQKREGERLWVSLRLRLWAFVWLVYKSSITSACDFKCARTYHVLAQCYKCPIHNNCTTMQPTGMCLCVYVCVFTCYMTWN